MDSPFGSIMQLGYVVEDIEQTALEWVERTGAGPFYRLESISLDQYYFRGKKTDLELSLCFGYWNDVQIELIHPLSKSDTLYSRALQDAPGKLNHMATLVPNLDALLDQQQLRDQIVQNGTVPPEQKFVYLENYLPGGLHLELIQSSASTLHVFAMMKELAQHWQEHQPLRPIESLMNDYTRLV